MKFWFSEYTLKPKNKVLPLRKGALIKIEWPDRMLGYADLLPWPDLGDEALSVQLKGLQKGKMSSMLEQTIWMARRDAQARKERRNLMKGLPRVRNALLVQDTSVWSDSEMGEARRLGFLTVKVKCGKNPVAELAFIEKVLRTGSFSIRLDFNGRLTFKEYSDFFKKIPSAFHNKIEYVEDPFPYGVETWREASKFSTLALDFEHPKVKWETMKAPLPFKVLVIKPARMDLASALDHVNKWGLKMVVTSNLDHPVGVMHASAVAGEMKKVYPNILLDCGCFTHLEYQQDEFSAQLPQVGPMTSEVPGYGVGFDSLFESLKWTAIES